MSPVPDHARGERSTRLDHNPRSDVCGRRKAGVHEVYGGNDRLVSDADMSAEADRVKIACDGKGRMSKEGGNNKKVQPISDFAASLRTLVIL